MCLLEFKGVYRNVTTKSCHFACPLSPLPPSSLLAVWYPVVAGLLSTGRAALEAGAPEGEGVYGTSKKL